MPRQERLFDIGVGVGQGFYKTFLLPEITVLSSQSAVPYSRYSLSDRTFFWTKPQKRK